MYMYNNTENVMRRKHVKRLSKPIAAILLVVLMAFALVGCKSSPKSEAEVPVTVVVPAPAPVVEPAPAPVVEEKPVAPIVEEPAAPAVEVEKPVTATISYYGFTANVVADDGKASVVYPTFITNDEMVGFCNYIASKYGAWVSGVEYSIPQAGILNLTYPKGISVADRSAALEVVVSEIANYVATLDLGAAAAETPAPVVEVAAPVTAVLAYYGYEANIVADETKATIAYPRFITNDEVAGFASYITQKYGSWVSDVYFNITKPGTLEITYPAVSVADREYAIQLVAAELTSYVQDMFAQQAQAEAAAAAKAAATAAAEKAAAEKATADAAAAAKAAADKAAAEKAAAEKAAAQAVVYPYGVKMIEKNEDGAQAFDLFIVHTNDVHARIVPADGGMGYAKLATLLNMGRSVTDNLLVLDAGDVTHGTNLANMFQGETVGVLLDMLGYDAVAPGNHDFNYGKDALIQAADIAEENGSLKVLSANIVDEAGYFVFQPYQLYDFNGFTIAVIGLTTPDTKTMSHPNNTVGLTFLDPVSAAIVGEAQWAVDTARAQGVDYVIVLGHIGLDPTGTGLTSAKIAEAIDGIDLFVDGHSHTVLPEGKVVNDTLIVSAGEYLKNVGLVQVSVVNDEVVGVYPMLIPASEVLDPATSELAKTVGITEVPADPEVQAYIDYMTKQLDKAMSVVIANIPMRLDGERADVRTKATNLSKMITAAMTEASGADFSITNGGGIRASINAGNVTVGDVNNVLPFTNYLTVCEIKGSDVYAALEHGYRLLPETNGAFSQTDLQVVYSKFSPAGSRIKRVLLNGKMIDKDATYKVATNDFMAAGGDGYTMFGNIIQEGKQLNEVLIGYLAKNYPVK